MHRLVRAYAHPFIREFGPELRPEPAHKNEGQVDGDELDVRRSVQHGHARTIRSAFPPLRHVRWRQQFRRIGPPRPVRQHSVENMRESSEEHTSELQSLMRISYAVFCLKKKNEHIYTTSHKKQLTKYDR